MALPQTALLHIRLLGELALRRHQTALPLPASRRTRALLGYLVATGQSHPRGALCDLLWEDPDDPRAALRWSLTKLRPLTDEPPLQRLLADREHVAFRAQDCQIDTATVHELLGAQVELAPPAALEQAAALLQGEFLGGLDLPACYRFHHWCMAQRERYGNLRRRVLGTLIDRLAAQPDLALPHARALVAADPLAESAHATLVRVLAASQRYPEAEQHYAWARALLRREVSMADGGPLDHAIRAARGALRQPVAARTAAAPHHADTLDGELPLVGRAAECAAIDRQLSGLAGARLLLFAGEPGIGKTRLLEHLAQAATAAGHAVLRGRCYEAEMVRPYGPWIDALRGFDAARLPPDLAAEAAPLLAAGSHTGSGSRESLFHAALALVRGLAGLQPLALLLDDLQWIDEGSAALLHFVMRRLEAPAPLVLAGAARGGELDDNTWARRLLRSLEREGRLQQVDVGPLAPAESAALLSAAGAAMESDLALRQAGGNPLYLLELSHAARRGSDAAGHSLDMLIGERLRTLDERTRDLLAWAAAIGRELRPELLAAATALPVADVLAQLERLERRGLLASAGRGRVDFSHDLVRDSVYRGLSQPRRRAIHRQLAHALQSASATDPQLYGETAHHAALAGDALAAARAWLAAGEQCLRVFANRDAAASADRGLSCLDELPPGAERTALEIGLLRLRLLAAVSPSGWAMPALAERLRRAIDAAEALELYAQAAAGWEALSLWQQQASDVAGARQATLSAQRATRRADAATHCRQLANSGRCLLDIEADVEAARELLQQADRLAAELQLQVMELEWGRGLLARRAGDLEAAAAALERALRLARAAQNHWREYECMVWAATIEWEQGRCAEVLRRADEIAAVVRRMGDTHAPFVDALAALARQRDTGADMGVALAAALQSLRDVDDKAHLAYALNEAATLALRAGRTADAEAHASEALACANAVRRPTEVAVATALLALARNDRPLLAALAQRPAGSARAAAAVAAALREIATLIPTPQAQDRAPESPGDPPCNASSSSARSTPRRPTTT